MNASVHYSSFLYISGFSPVPKGSEDRFSNLLETHLFKASIMAVIITAIKVIFTLFNDVNELLPDPGPL